VSSRRTTLKPHLNAIRAWVAEGATDIWIAHKLGTQPASVTRFRRQHDLLREGERGATAPATAEAPVTAGVPASAAAPSAAPATKPAEAATEPAPARRRRRRGGRGRGGGEARADTATADAVELEGVFDHGDDGYGLWLDGAVRDAAVYRRHWQGHRAVRVRVTADEITIRRSDDA
jgi:hypothetical protein